MTRQTIKKYLPKNHPTLEIGPYLNPFIKKDEYDVYYADVRNEQDVLDLFKTSDVDKIKNTPIDYIIKGTYLETVGEKRFNSVFSSHVIEHTVDVIRHLEEVSQILVEDGFYVMCIPDKRFTFDYFRDVTPFRDAYDVYKNGNSALKRLVFDCTLNYNRDFSSIRQYYERSVSFEKFATDKTIVDNVFRAMEAMTIGGSHYWVFTFISFLQLLRDCLRLNMLPYRLEYADGTNIMSFEFYIVLKKDTNIQKDIKLREAEIKKINKIIEQPKGQIELVEFMEKYKSIYFYGSPQAAKFLIDKVLKYYNKIAGLVISDSFEKESFELPVYHISEIALTKDIGIVLSMVENNRELVYGNLQKMGFDNVLKDPLVD